MGIDYRKEINGYLFKTSLKSFCLMHVLRFSSFMNQLALITVGFFLFHALSSRLLFYSFIQSANNTN
ncbi:UNVERIFIED_CONTAM: hypothetical protein NCL1_30520 [Trichonephila clavipes]